MQEAIHNRIGLLQIWGRDTDSKVSCCSPNSWTKLFLEARRTTFQDLLPNNLRIAVETCWETTTHKWPLFMLWHTLANFKIYTPWSINQLFLEGPFQNARFSGTQCSTTVQLRFSCIAKKRATCARRRLEGGKKRLMEWSQKCLLPIFSTECV